MNNAIFSLTGQRVLVIGASGQMGRAIADSAAALGARLILAGRTQSGLDDVAAALGPSAETLAGDFSDAVEAKRLFGMLEHVDHVAVATSAGARAGSLATSDPTEVRKAFSRLWTAANVIAAAPSLVRAGGSVTLISGSSAKRPVKGFGVWTTLHGAIDSLARGAAVDIAPIRVNVVSPGGIGMKPDRQLVERAATAAAIGQAAVALMTNPIITSAVLDVDAGERLGEWPAATRA